MNDNDTVCLRVGAVKNTYNIKRVTLYNSTDVSYYGGQCTFLQQQPRMLARMQFYRLLRVSQAIHSNGNKVTQM